MEESLIARLLDRVAAENAGRPHFEPVISRATAENAILAILNLRGCRGSDAAAVYGYDRLYRALGIDWSASKIVFLPEPGSAENS